WSCPLTDEGLKGLQSIILREREQVKQVKLQARERYLHALSGAENVNFDPASDDEFYSDSDDAQMMTPRYLNSST
ncbi:hypothetical protein ILYODFUR_032288, partial [Ilyodon furcidens]